MKRVLSNVGRIGNLFYNSPARYFTEETLKLSKLLPSTRI
jgi:hypothetical protein